MSAFLFDEHHAAFRQSVHRFSQDKLAAGYLERARSTAFFWDVYRLLGEHGLLGLGVSEANGGQGADLIAVGIACEEVARADFNVAFAMFNSAIAGGMLERNLQPALRAEWLPGLISGELLTGLALTEPDSGSDAQAMRTRATKVDGGWLLNGEKTSASLAAHAHGLIVFAKSSPERTSREVTAFFVPLDAPGVTRRPFDDTGFRPIGRAAVSFEDTFVSDKHLMGEIGRGFPMVLGEFDYTRALLGLLTIGTAMTAIDLTVEYAKKREAFGQPIAKFEGVTFPLAEHATYIEGVRWLCHHTLALRQAGLPHTKEAAMIKWWGPRTAVQAIHDCIVLHGHVAYSEDLPLQQMLRDVSGLEIGDGTPQIQKLIVAREIFGREYLPYSRA
ncbi:acyl-CoA dehydrogenase family protein [Pseudonocardia sp. NPDC046786]|uniref:acyl-CoA dehydrogenase family protein n=1 Tax=Pseudonocardia sp. NPDC046786 TaxID=3155471 RepID=UPI0033E0846B